MDWETFTKCSHEEPHKVKGLLITFYWDGKYPITGIVTYIIYGPRSRIRYELTCDNGKRYTVGSTTAKSFKIHSDKERMLFKLKNDL